MQPEGACAFSSCTIGGSGIDRCPLVWSVSLRNKSNFSWDQVVLWTLTQRGKRTSLPLWDGNVILYWPLNLLGFFNCHGRVIHLHSFWANRQQLLQKEAWPVTLKNERWIVNTVLVKICRKSHLTDVTVYISDGKAFHGLHNSIPVQKTLFCYLSFSVLLNKGKQIRPGLKQVVRSTAGLQLSQKTTGQGSSSCWPEA